MTIDRMLVTENHSLAGCGGIALREGHATVTTLEVVDNHAAGGGGGLWLDERVTGTLDQLVVIGNTAGEAGAGSGEPEAGSSPSATRGSRTTWRTRQGGISMVAGDLVLRTAVIAGNSAARGAGIHANGAGVTMALDGVVNHGNTASEPGGGLRVDGGATVDLVSSSVTGNQAPTGGGVLVDAGAVSMAFSNLWGNSPDDIVGAGDPVGADGNIGVDASFVGAAAPGWDLHLGVDSPLIDAGDPAMPDPDASPADIGAYGGPSGGSWDLDGDGYPGWWHPGPYDSSTDPAAGWDCDDLDRYRYPGQGC